MQVAAEIGRETARMRAVATDRGATASDRRESTVRTSRSVAIRTDWLMHDRLIAVIGTEAAPTHRSHGRLPLVAGRGTPFLTGRSTTLHSRELAPRASGTPNPST